MSKFTRTSLVVIPCLLYYSQQFFLSIMVEKLTGHFGPRITLQTREKLTTINIFFIVFLKFIHQFGYPAASV